jgi:Spx/MgsR family transcriptional regulator
MKLRVYEYSGCSTCKKALKFLDAKGVSYEKVPIVDQPPTAAELKRMLAIVGDFKKLFNTSGLLYREMKIGDRIKAGMTESEAITLLSKHGKLVKRPFVLAGSAGAVGFKEPEWKKFLTR